MTDSNRVRREDEDRVRRLRGGEEEEDKSENGDSRNEERKSIPKRREEKNFRISQDTETSREPWVSCPLCG